MGRKIYSSYSLILLSKDFYLLVLVLQCFLFSISGDLSFSFATFGHRSFFFHPAVLLTQGFFFKLLIGGKKMNVRLSTLFRRHSQEGSVFTQLVTSYVNRESLLQLQQIS